MDSRRVQMQGKVASGKPFVGRPQEETTGKLQCSVNLASEDAQGE
jgi:hypothetical protein